MAITLFAEKIGQIGPLPVTNTLVVSWVVVIALCLFAYFAGRKTYLLPSRFQNFAEMIMEPILNMTKDLAHQKAMTFFPVVMTFFLYIIVANWLGLFPGFGTVGFYETHQAAQAAQQAPLLEQKVSGHVNEAGSSASQGLVASESKTEFVPLMRSINADLNMTLGLALCSVVITHIFAIRFLGIWDYLKKWFSLNPIFLFVGLLELISEVTKTLSLSLRLFGNIFAGEVVLSTISNLLAFIAPLPFYFLEIIVGIVQAAVFTLLTLVFMVLLSEKHVGEEHASVDNK